jgi:hypothetical protein
VVAARLQGGAQALGQALNREANVLAYNDTFRFVAGVALLTALYLGYIIVYNIVRRRRAEVGAA